MQTFDYDDIQLIPNKCIIKSRREADTSVKFGPRTFKIPVVPANMESVINEDLAVWLAQSGYYYVMHRFEPADRAGFIKRMHERGLFASISVGIKDTEYDFIDQLKAEHLDPEYVTIDVAHGHSDFVIKMIKYIKKNLPNSFVTAGNVATPKAARKPIIADGGIRHNGDIAKSVRFGASMVMIGSMLAGHLESPGHVITIDGKRYKQYWGSASEVQKGAYRNVEGKQMLVPFRGSIKDTLREMEEDLQSAISYAGGRDLEAIRKVDYVIVKNSILNGDY
ncbi:IMP dehydrogenase [Limosilactobacillus pontis]|uniref:IMP dehydrogenase n=1 Tax=Limosilactobacillus pontis TaxID=35787 RepID=UPI00241E59B8|nr:IMP dehydrogenase [Limosilactobacillus pontis]